LAPYRGRILWLRLADSLPNGEEPIRT